MSTSRRCIYLKPKANLKNEGDKREEYALEKYID